MLQKGFKPDVIIVSPLRRCLQTAAIVGRILGVTHFKIDERVREVVAYNLEKLQTKFETNGYITQSEMQDILSEQRSETLTIKYPPSIKPQPLDRGTDNKVYWEDFSQEFSGKRYLIVTHGDRVAHYTKSKNPFVDEVYQCNECAYALFDDKYQFHVKSTDPDLQYIKLDD